MVSGRSGKPKLHLDGCFGTGDTPRHLLLGGRLRSASSPTPQTPGWRRLHPNINHHRPCAGPLSSWWHETSVFVSRWLPRAFVRHAGPETVSNRWEVEMPKVRKPDLFGATAVRYEKRRPFTRFRGPLAENQGRSSRVIFSSLDRGSISFLAET